MTTCILSMLQEMEAESAKSSALWQQLQDLQKQLTERDAATEKLNAQITALKKSNEVALFIFLSI